MNPGNYSISLCNGQRIYQSAYNLLITPPRGSEIFVGNLPSDLYEDHLIPLFSEIGPIWKLRLMMDFSGNTRGFCFVTYFNTEHANEAVLRFNRRMVKSPTKTAMMTVDISIDNRKLFFREIPLEMKSEHMENELKRYFDGVKEVITYPDQENPRHNRGYAFVEFVDHAAAAIVRRKLLSGVVGLWNNLEQNKLYVDWAEPEPIVDPKILAQVKILYFKNLPVSWNVGRFKQFILDILRPFKICKMFKRYNYGFVHFLDRSEAVTALNFLQIRQDLLTFPDNKIVVEWARPPAYSKENRKADIPNNLCVSVPPKTRKIINKAKYGQTRFLGGGVRVAPGYGSDGNSTNGDRDVPSTSGSSADRNRTFSDSSDDGYCGFFQRYY